MQTAGKWLCVLGLCLIVAGLFMMYRDRLGPLAKILEKIPLGRLPGDVSIKRDGFSIYFPWVSCLVVSAVLSFLFYLFRR